MFSEKYDYMVVCSSAGGAALAEQLGQRKESILVIEIGHNGSATGRFGDAQRNNDAAKGTNPLITKSKEGLILWRTLMPGESVL
jgi:choline dehydrogenase-like flavoprotein